MRKFEGLGIVPSIGLVSKCCFLLKKVLFYERAKTFAENENFSGNRKPFTKMCSYSISPRNFQQNLVIFFLAKVFAEAKEQKNNFWQIFAKLRKRKLKFYRACVNRTSLI
jgi:hypothetical protein